MSFELLGAAAAERKLYGTSRDLYAQAAEICHPPELKVGNEAETALTEPDAIQFWQAYLLWHEGQIGQGRERYEALLGRYNQGWQVAQMMYDLAVQSRQQLRLEEAVEWAGKAAQVLPKSGAVLDLRKSCEEILAADRPLAASVAELQEAVKSATQPEAKAERTHENRGGPVSTKPIRRGGARTAPGLGGLLRVLLCAEGHVPRR